MSWLSVQSLTKTFNEHVVLDALHLELKKGERLAIAGETGSGKSTLLKIMAGLIQPDKGNVIFDGTRVLGPEEKLLPGLPSIQKCLGSQLLDTQCEDLRISPNS